MNEAQKIIKYLALAFAVFIIYTIITAVSNGFILMGNVIDIDDNKPKDFSNIDINENVSILDINIINIDVILKQGETLKAETNNNYIKIKQENNKIFINQEKRYKYKKDKPNLIVYIPKDLIFDKVSMELKAGKLDIDNLNTNNLYLTIKAGKLNINNLNVINKSTIEGGVGDININNGIINNLYLELGVGKSTINCKLTGKNNIETGIGKTDLFLMGTLRDYQIELDKGLGSYYLNNKEMYGDITYGTGINKIDIEGGIGSILINTNER